MDNFILFLYSFFLLIFGHCSQFLPSTIIAFLPMPLFGSPVSACSWGWNEGNVTLYMGWRLAPAPGDTPNHLPTWFLQLWGSALQRLTGQCQLFLCHWWELIWAELSLPVAFNIALTLVWEEIKSHFCEINQEDWKLGDFLFIKVMLFSGFAAVGCWESEQADAALVSIKSEKSPPIPERGRSWFGQCWLLTGFWLPHTRTDPSPV